MRIPQPFGRKPDDSESPRRAPGDDPLEPPRREEPSNESPQAEEPSGESPQPETSPSGASVADRGNGGGEREREETTAAAEQDHEPEQAPEAEQGQEQPDEQEQEQGQNKEHQRKKVAPKTGHHSLHEGEFTAPSVGPHTTFDKRPPEERLDFDKISDIDAMGKDKRRTVVGGTYGPTRARVFATFATFFAVVAALVFGFYLLAQELDKPPAENPAEAPWSQADAPQIPPREIQ